MKRYPEAADNYAGRPFEQRRLGEVHVATAADGVWIASMVAQVGYGPPAGRPRLRLDALRMALRRVAQLAHRKGAEVHMPLVVLDRAGRTGRRCAHWCLKN